MSKKANSNPGYLKFMAVRLRGLYDPLAGRSLNTLHASSENLEAPYANTV